MPMIETLFNSLFMMHALYGNVVLAFHLDYSKPEQFLDVKKFRSGKKERKKELTEMNINEISHNVTTQGLLCE